MHVEILQLSEAEECVTQSAGVTAEKATGSEASGSCVSAHLVVFMRSRYIIIIPTRPLLLNIYISTK